jgi:hypothetical protein
MLTMPRSWPSWTTGRWRILANVIAASAASMRSSERQLITREDISFCTSRPSVAAPWCAIVLTKSRSEKMPTKLHPLIFDDERSDTMFGKLAHREHDAVRGADLDHVVALGTQNISDQH